MVCTERVGDDISVGERVDSNSVGVSWRHGGERKMRDAGELQGLEAETSGAPGGQIDISTVTHQTPNGKCTPILEVASQITPASP